MPSSSSSQRQSSKRRSQGGGRTANSEPRMQVFSQFNGCNFQLSPHDYTRQKLYQQEQSDLQMNYLVVQNDAVTASNKTIETRNDVVKLLDAPEGRKFTDASILIGNELYIGLDDGSIAYGRVDSDGTAVDGYVEIVDHSDEPAGHHWSSFAYIDDKLVGTTLENRLWTGELGSHRLENARLVPDPEQLTMGNLMARAQLSVSNAISEDQPFRIAVAISYINKYGPTACSPQFTFYASAPVDEWHATQYLRLFGTVPQGYGIEAVEVYYTVGNSSTLQFAGRTDRIEGGERWYFDWYGYLDVTSMWPMANLLSPTENVTEGVKASRVKAIDGRLYFWGSEDNPQRLWIGGNPGNLFSISPGTGGGFVDVEPGSGLEIRVVDKYKTQSGASIVTMLCDSDNSTREQRFNLVENSVTISNEQYMKSWQAEQVAGAVGCKSFHGAVVCADGMYSVSRYGLALITMTMEYNSQIQTTYVSDPIKPAFTSQYGRLLSDSVVIERDGIIYLMLGSESGGLDKVIFCYDIGLKAWWTFTPRIDSIVGMLHIDYEGSREGIGLIADDSAWLVPLTQDDGPEDGKPLATVTLQFGELSTVQPQQNWFYLSQIEFDFDYFVGDLTITVTGIDQFGRFVTTRKTIQKDEPVYNFTDYMRVDLRLRSYQIRMNGHSRMRLSHFISKLYTMSSKQGLVWGFDDNQTFRGGYNNGDIHPTFKDYNDIKRAIVP